ncbi:hypothetical protein [Streptomyces sp. NBC_00338]|uniref:hypothetical protein n=1 Tax=Streptomyces sp. NBC_00338 TaxID=2975715 RepID=UPI00225764F7|nr:hypothetical protein [Streptomyces sp. NBC_00338]MCX5144650.1 hypothetical protein [Streptomyces sp. NBC_00338]MCX5145054.1 hypothetical protein [Streptomyces sp. NBC_00338]
MNEAPEAQSGVDAESRRIMSLTSAEVFAEVMASKEPACPLCEESHLRCIDHGATW